MPDQQTTSHLLMIRPVQFGFNAETAVNNRFQLDRTGTKTQEQALQEFDSLVSALRRHDIDVTVVNDTPQPHTPDSVFPNNWVSFHENGRIYLYPMFAPNRRLEKKETVINAIREKFLVRETADLSGYQQSGSYLEGTGSMVLDRGQRIAYACLSARTHTAVLAEFCSREGYRSVTFTARDSGGVPIYHTNVMMCVADRYVVICLDSISDLKEKQMVQDTITASGKELITITPEQMDHFAGNMLQVTNRSGEPFLVMSTQAYESLTPQQRDILSGYNPVIHADIRTIETNGGGSARCMIAEVFLPPVKDN